MITFYGYAVKKNGRYLGYNPMLNKFSKMFKKQFYKSPRFPCVDAFQHTQEKYNGYLGEVVKVKLTMEECEDCKGNAEKEGK